MNYSALAKSYNTLIYTKQLRQLLCSFYKSEKFNDLSKIELARIVNKELLQNYQGEQVLKYKLAKEFKGKNYIAAFEVRAKSSRTDFLAINGYTKSFEVKSGIDNLNRLQKQIADYGDVFEFNTVVIDKIHLKNVLKQLPEYYGVWYFVGNKKSIYREAAYSPKINPVEQLGLMNKRELLYRFKSNDKKVILRDYTAEEINQQLKNGLKERYFNRWSFVQKNWENILPIDLQFFFNTNVHPAIIYGI